MNTTKAAWLCACWARTERRGDFVLVAAAAYPGDTVAQLELAWELIDAADDNARWGFATTDGGMI